MSIVRYARAKGIRFAGAAAVLAALAVMISALALSGSEATAARVTGAADVVGQAIPAAETTTGTTAVALSAGGNLIGWFGLPTTSAAILAGNSAIDTLWAFDPPTWTSDSESLPSSLRSTIDVTQGTGLFLVTSQATTLEVPTSTISTETLGVFQDTTGALSADSGTPVDGEVTLTRTLTGLSATFTISGLTPGDTYTAWMVIFNNPAACVDGCDETDLGIAAVDAALVNGDGLIADATGTGTFNASLVVGDFGHHQVPLFANTVTNSMGAEVHTVIRNHGPELADPSEVIEQITILAGGCTEATSVDGTGTGPNACFDPFVAVFMP